jgi:hypothetical protein
MLVAQVTNAIEQMNAFCLPAPYAVGYTRLLPIVQKADQCN